MGQKWTTEVIVAPAERTCGWRCCFRPQVAVLQDSGGIDRQDEAGEDTEQGAGNVVPTEKTCSTPSCGWGLTLRPLSGASFDARFPVRKKNVELLNASLRDGTAERKAYARAQSVVPSGDFARHPVRSIARVRLGRKADERP